MLTLHNILFPTDFSEQAETIFEQALLLAQQYDATLHVLHVVEQPATLTDILSGEQERLSEHAEAQALERLQQLLAACPSGSVLIEQAVVRHEKAAPAVLAYAQEHAIDLIVLGTRGESGLKRLLLGSTAEEIVRRAPCPVFAVREHEGVKPRAAIRNILKPIDFSDANRHALACAKQLAAAYGAHLQLLHVIEDYAPIRYEMADDGPVRFKAEDLEGQITERMQRLVEETPGPDVAVSYHVADGHAAGGIIDFAEAHDTDLIVLAAHGHAVLDRFFLGGTAGKVVRNALCPVFVVREAPRRAPTNDDPAASTTCLPDAGDEA